MPTFGDYETFGEPVATTVETGHVTTVWQARKPTAGDNRVYAVKCYEPLRRAIKEGQAGEELKEDRALNFLRGIKDLKKAQSEGGRYLAPVHAFGTAPEGAWYVTDYFELKTLKEWVDRRVRVDDAALRHVVYSVVSGCLALKRSRELKYSHGNLKPSNVMLGGKSRRLRQVPLYLTDLHPAPLQLADLDTESRRTVGELLEKVVEVQDLRAIGELVFQLVEGRLIQATDDRHDSIDWPIKPSVEWDKLGKRRDRWVDLCNRLLDPKLSLEKESLEKLEAEFRPSAIDRNWRRIGVALAVVCLLGLASWLWVREILPLFKNREYLLAMGNARKYLNITNPEPKDLKTAEQHVKKALQAKRGDPEGTKLRQAIQQRRVEECSNAVQLANQALGRNDFIEADRQKDRASEFRPEDSEVKGLPAKIEEYRNKEYQEGIAEASKAGDRRDYEAMQNQAKRALKARPKDPTAEELLSKAQDHHRKLKEYDTAMEKGNGELDAKRWGNAKENFTNAVELAKSLRDSELQSSAQKKANEAEYKNLISQAAEAKKSGHIDEERALLESAQKINNTKEVRDLLTATEPPTTPPPPNPDELLRRAENALTEAVTSQDLVNSSNQFAAILMNYPGNQHALGGADFVRGVQEGLAFKRQNDYRSAANSFAQALTKRPEHKLAQKLKSLCAALAAGVDYAKAWNFIAACTNFSQAQAVDGEDADVSHAARFVRLPLEGDADYRKGLFGKALTNYTEARGDRFYGPYVTNRLEMAIARQSIQGLLSQDDYEGAIKGLANVARFEALLRLEPANGSLAATNLKAFATHAKAGRGALAQGQFADAIGQYGLALKAWPDNQRVTNWKALAGHLDQGKQHLLKGEFTNAAAEFSGATNLASLLQDKGQITDATRRRDFAEALALAKASAGTNNFNLAWSYATNAVLNGTKVVTPEEIAVAKDLALSVASNAFGFYISVRDLSKVTNWLACATNFSIVGQLPRQTRERMQKAVVDLTQDLSNPPITNVFGIPDFDFKRFDGFGTKKARAWVAVNELSWQQYSNILGRISLLVKTNLLKAQGSEDGDLPAHIQFPEATNFTAELDKQKGAASLIMPDAPEGHWRLPTLEEYKFLATQVGVTDFPQDDHWTLDTNTVVQLRKEGEWIFLFDKPSVPPRSITAQTNLHDLREVIGNVREWTADGKSFGIASSSDYDASLNRRARGADKIGLRLVYEEGPGPAGPAAAAKK